MKRNAIIAAVIVVLVVVLTGSYKKVGSLGNIFSKNTDIGQEAAKQKVTDFVKNNLVQPGTEVAIKSIAEDSGMYKIILEVGKQEIETYITKDGTKFFPQVMNIAETEEKTKKAAEENSKPEEIAKSDKPAVDLYVMSFCPYGNKAEDTLASVYALLKNKVDFNFHYIVNSSGGQIQSLHGQKEVDQNEREACVLKNYDKDKWMDFVTYVNANCGSDGSCWEAGAKSLSLDTAKISSCVASSGADLMKVEEKASTDAGASGSPTMLINGTTTKSVYQYGNSNAYKQAICSAFNTAPEECSKELSAQTSTTEGGSCGN
jgi:hypothetical protein